MTIAPTDADVYQILSMLDLKFVVRSEPLGAATPTIFAPKKDRSVEISEFRAPK